jgi:hypothetical protein
MHLLPSAASYVSLVVVGPSAARVLLSRGSSAFGIRPRTSLHVQAWQRHIYEPEAEWRFSPITVRIVVTASANSKCIWRSVCPRHCLSLASPSGFDKDVARSVIAEVFHFTSTRIQTLHDAFQNGCRCILWWHIMHDLPLLGVWAPRRAQVLHSCVCGFSDVVIGVSLA